MPLTDSSETYIRPYGDDAPWNIPIDGLSLHERSDELAELLWNDTFTDREDRNFNIQNTAYTYPVYYVEPDTPTYPVNSANPDWGNLHGEEIPFDPSWEPAVGTDAQIIILDPATGREWNLHKVDFDGETVNVNNGNLVPGSYFENEEGFSPSRGVGIQYLAMLVRPEEIEQGIIEHALSMPVNNTSGLEYFAPATKIEHPDHPDGIPEGARYSLDVTYEEIDEHLASLPDSVSDVTKESLRVIMVAMKDYGWFITDTAGANVIQLEAMETAGDDWARLGLVNEAHDGKVYPRDALDGLITLDRLVAYVPSDEYDTSTPVADTTVDEPIEIVEVQPEETQPVPETQPVAEVPEEEPQPEKEFPGEGDFPGKGNGGKNFISKLLDAILKIFGIGGDDDDMQTALANAQVAYDDAHEDVVLLSDILPVTGSMDDESLELEEDEEDFVPVFV